MYFEILRSFAANTQPLLESVKGVSKDNLPDYAIVVHGIKGSSRGINANEFGDIAESLESAAKKGDFDYISKHNPGFLKAAWKLLAGIDELLSSRNTSESKPKKEKPEREMLDKLMLACENYDMDGADKAMSELEQYEYEEGDELVFWLSENVEQMNFTDIIEKLTGLEAAGENRTGE